MKKPVFVSLVLLLLAAWLITGCSQAESSEAQAAPLPQEEPATPVEVATAQTGDITLVYSYAGNLEARDSVSIMPGASGRVTALLAEVGDEVKKDEPIAIVDQGSYLARLRQAEAGLATAKLNIQKMEIGPRPEELAAAQAAVQLARASVDDVATIDDDERTRAASQLASAQAMVRQAQAEYDKIGWAGDVGQTPQAVTLEQATVAYETALANYNLATNPSDSQLAPLMAQLTQAELALALTLQPFRPVDFAIAETAVEQAEAAVELARLQLDDTTIKAPFDGLVAELYISEGGTVGPQSPVALFVTNEIEVVIDVEENRIGQVYEDQYAALRVAAFPGRDFPAVVNSVAPVADTDTHTFAVKITPIDEEGLLRSGMYADVSLLANEKQSTLLVPRAAIVLYNNQETVYVVNDNNTVEQRAITTGLINGEYAEIIEGLEPGDTVVIAGQSNLVDGAPVEIVSGS